VTPALTQHPALERLRAVYLCEVEEMAEKLRPCFEAGELRAPVDADLERGDQAPGWQSPTDRLEAICAERLGLQVTKTKTDQWMILDADSAVAHAVLMASPTADALGDAGWSHVAFWAQSAAAWDVLRIARSRGWSVPLPGECRDPLDEEAEWAAQHRPAGSTP
jgi:hypothetical protein